MSAKICLKAVFFITAMLWASGAVAVSTMKCGHRIVNIGDTSLEVLNRCGEPTFREFVGTDTEGAIGSRTRDSRGRVRRGRFDEFSVKVERWYYDCGRNQFVRILTFRGGILKRIETGDYGVGASDCTGRRDQRTNESAETQEQKYGAISILGAPYGADVYLDGRYMGKVPATLEQIDPGDYTLSVRSSGYREWVKRIIVEPGETEFVNVYLRETGEAFEQKPEAAESVPATPPKKIYKWTDEEGHIHITNHPPPEGFPTENEAPND